MLVFIILVLVASVLWQINNRYRSEARRALQEDRNSPVERILRGEYPDEKEG